LRAQGYQGSPELEMAIVSGIMPKRSYVHPSRTIEQLRVTINK
jgi:hypothetical protein